MDSVGREIYSNQQPEYRHIRENYFQSKNDVDMRIFFFDIEVITKDRSFPDPQEAIQRATKKAGANLMRIVTVPSTKSVPHRIETSYEYLQCSLAYSYKGYIESNIEIVQN